MLIRGNVFCNEREILIAWPVSTVVELIERESSKSKVEFLVSATVVSTADDVVFVVTPVVCTASVVEVPEMR